MRSTIFILAIFMAMGIAAEVDPRRAQITQLADNNDLAGIATLGKEHEKAIKTAKVGQITSRAGAGLQFASLVLFLMEPSKPVYDAVNGVYKSCLRYVPPDSTDPGIVWDIKERVAKTMLHEYMAYYDTLNADRAFPYLRERVDLVNELIQELKAHQVPGFDHRNSRRSMPEDLVERERQWAKQHPYGGRSPAAVQHSRNQYFIQESLPQLQNDLRAFITKKYPNKPEAKRHARKILGELGFNEEKIDLTIAVIERE
ncbi:MAG: hypothetical protein PF961_21930 [Planctomycetota bacterium]|jgi:hypothetical protein|nr:hypothetical protein [Planctomycetota bacterium]